MSESSDYTPSDTREKAGVRTQYREPWFLSNDNDDAHWVITDGVEYFEIRDATDTEFGLAVTGTLERGANVTLNREALAKVVEEHHHVYDSDCQEDFGCECGEKEWSGEHVAGAVLALLGGADRG